MRRGPGPLSDGLRSYIEHLGPGIQIKICHDDEEGSRARAPFKHVSTKHHNYLIYCYGAWAPDYVAL